MTHLLQNSHKLLFFICLYTWWGPTLCISGLHFKQVFWLFFFLSPLEWLCKDCIKLWRLRDMCVNMCCLCKQKPWTEPNLSHSATFNSNGATPPVSVHECVCVQSLELCLGRTLLGNVLLRISWKVTSKFIFYFLQQFYISMCIKKSAHNFGLGPVFHVTTEKLRDQNVSLLLCLATDS